ncbi:MAG: type II secretory pathway protein ExeA, partial [Halothiobacillaceae bacterium]
AGFHRPLFTDGAIRQVWKLSGGIPRLINILCDRSLLGAYSVEASQVATSIVKNAYAEIQGDFQPLYQHMPSIKWMLLVAGVAAVTVVLWLGKPVWESWLLAWRQPAAQSPVASDSGSLQEAVPPLINTGGVNQIEAAGADSVQPQRFATAAEFAQFIRKEPTSTDLKAAFHFLFELWDLDYGRHSSVSGCEYATAAELRCYWGTDSWQQYVTLDLPALLWLPSDEEEEYKHYYLVVALPNNEVEIDVGGQRYRLPQNEMQALWPAKFLTVWRPPAGFPDILSPGDRGEEVVWLREQINAYLDLKVHSNAPQLFDVRLQEQVKKFQRLRGLGADGLVGEMTL